jgi:hypothetical protein
MVKVDQGIAGKSKKDKKSLLELVLLVIKKEE